MENNKYCIYFFSALAQLLDNTALYSEFQLKMPDVTDRIMKTHNEWMILIKWAIFFSNSTGLFDAKTSTLLNLVCFLCLF